MSVTAAQVISRINNLFSNTTGGKWTDAELLEAVNAAIDDAWPHMRAVSQDTSQTLVSTTYEYTPSATPDGIDSPMPIAKARSVVTVAS